MPSREALIAASGGSIHEHRKTTRKMRWWYESLADFMIANPRATQNEIAAHFGRATSTISTIVNTDMFKAYFRQRRDQHAEVLDASVRSKLMNVADKSLDMMLDHLEKKRDTIPLEGLQRNLETTLKSLGYGQSSPQVAVTVNNAQPTVIPVAVSMEDLQAAREALRRNQMQQAQVIDHEPATLAPPEADE
jgi:ribosomal protein L25 (general stress protein Ctc)